MKPATKKVLLKKGAKFSALVPGKPGGKSSRKRYTGPCEVLMTEVQVEAFKDLLQSVPQTTVIEEPKVKPESESKADKQHPGNV